MFLDDKLYQMCQEADKNTAEAIQKLYSEVMKECEAYIKSNVIPGISTTEQCIVTINRTFKLYDSFINQLMKDPKSIDYILGKLFKANSFKDAYFKNEKIKEFYYNHAQLHN